MSRRWRLISGRPGHDKGGPDPGVVAVTDDCRRLPVHRHLHAIAPGESPQWRGRQPPANVHGFRIELRKMSVRSHVHASRLQKIRIGWIHGRRPRLARYFAVLAEVPRDKWIQALPGGTPNSRTVSAISRSLRSTRKFTVPSGYVPSGCISPAGTPVSTSIPSSIVRTG